MKIIKRGFAMATIATMFLSGSLYADTDVSHNWNAEGEHAALAVFKATYESLGGTWKEFRNIFEKFLRFSVSFREISRKFPMM